jgi:hypothetical protein
LFNAPSLFFHLKKLEKLIGLFLWKGFCTKKSKFVLLELRRIVMEEKVPNKENKYEELTPTPKGESSWKLPEDDDIDVNEIFDCPIIPGTSGVEC